MRLSAQSWKIIPIPRGWSAAPCPTACCGPMKTKTSPPFWWGCAATPCSTCCGRPFSSPIDLAARRGTTPACSPARTGPCCPRSERPYLPAPYGNSLSCARTTPACPAPPCTWRREASCGTSMTERGSPKKSVSPPGRESWLSMPCPTRPSWACPRPRLTASSSMPSTPFRTAAPPPWSSMARTPVISANGPTTSWASCCP